MNLKVLILILSIPFISSCIDDKSTPSGNNSNIDLTGLGYSIPHFKIDTNGKSIPDEPKIDGTLEIIEQNQIIGSKINVAIERRGSTSQTEFDKKSFGFEVRDMEGMDLSLEILDLASEEDWILNGPYSDKTLIRNLLIYHLSNEIGAYAPKSRLIELSLNDTYVGVYVLLEKIKRDKNRVNIKKLTKESVEGDDLTGGYILKIDKTSGNGNGSYDYNTKNSFRSKYSPNQSILPYSAYGAKQPEETYFLYEYPDSDDIEDVQKNYIQQYISEFEEALISEDFSTQERPYLDYISLSSFVDNFIMNELASNPDAYRLSSFLYKDKLGKLNFGPIWDFNIAMGNDSRARSDVWIFNYNERHPNDLWLIHFWWIKMLQDPMVKEAIKTRWTSLRATILSTDNLLSQIDKETDYLISEEGVRRNFSKWDILNKQIAFNSQVAGSYNGEIQYLKDWFTARLKWMDGEIQNW